VSDVKSVAGTWKGVVYESGSHPDYVTLTIREDGTYDIVSRQTIGASRGKGPDSVLTAELWPSRSGEERR